MTDGSRDRRRDGRKRIGLGIVCLLAPALLLEASTTGVSGSGLDRDLDPNLRRLLRRLPSRPPERARGDHRPRTAKRLLGSTLPRAPQPSPPPVLLRKRGPSTLASCDNGGHVHAVSFVATASQDDEEAILRKARRATWPCRDHNNLLRNRCYRQAVRRRRQA